MKTRSFCTALLPLTLLPAAFSQTAALPKPQYTVTDLVANVGGGAAVTDPNLVNAWGIGRSSGGPWWVSDNATGLSTLYSGTTGAVVPLVVTIPPANPKVSPTGSPTGTIFNGTTDFAVAPGKPAVFLFATEDGTISGWNPGAAPSTAIIAVNEPKSVFKGLTMAIACLHGACNNDLYVANFGQGRVSVYDATFHHLPEIEAAFAAIALPAGYAPFNVQNLGGNIYVTLAKQDAAKHDEVDGAGLGMVEVVSPTGELLQTFQTGSFLNAPWGLALASSDFGPYSHDVLVGNFGSGQIAVFDPITGHYKGLLRDANNAVITISGLWGLSFGNSTANGGPATTLFFAAGPHNEQDGLFGSITSINNPAGNDQ